MRRGRGGRGRGTVALPLDIGATSSKEAIIQGIARGRGRGRARATTSANVSGLDITTTQCVRGRGRGRGRGGTVRGGGRIVVDDFIQATSSNLPFISCYSVAEYYKNMKSSELRQAKDQISASADYGENAIGYVRLKRLKSTCTVEAKITPQTSVNNKPYIVAVAVDEKKLEIIVASCNCQASKGSCKHQTALIFWLLRRSEEPSPTEVQCYWKRSILSTVKGLKSKTIDELSSRSTKLGDVDNSLLEEFITLGKDCNKDSGVIRYSDENINQVTLYVDHLMISFSESRTEKEITAKNFLSYCSQQMTTDRCLKVYNETLDQSKKAEWYLQRFARITASKLYECSRCQTTDGSLVVSLLGARTFKGNFATNRGLKLEEDIFELLKKKYPDIKKCGIKLTAKRPMFGASPDGINKDFTFEIKCPTKVSTIENYVRKGIVQDKYFFQMQLQMLLCDKRKGILCVADVNFEKNHKVSEYKVQLDERRLGDVLQKCEKFWEKVIFPNLK